MIGDTREAGNFQKKNFQNFQNFNAISNRDIKDKGKCDPFLIYNWDRLPIIIISHSYRLVNGTDTIVYPPTI